MVSILGANERAQARRALIERQLPHCLVDTQFDFLGQRCVGKVRDSYVQSSSRVMITTDRLSCFDRVVTSIPYKGVTLQSLALYWFTRSSSIIAHHIRQTIDPQAMLVHSCDVLPIEVVVRGYLAGSAWRDYRAGKLISGVRLPPGMRRHQKLAEPLLTPSTKAAAGDHDTPISEREIIEQKIVAADLWKQVSRSAHALFEMGSREAAKRDLILVDTKYEFGLKDGQLMLVDEIHTLDSSRYWRADPYAQRFAADAEQEMLDKEPTRQWLLAQGFSGDGAIPHFSDEQRCMIAEHYISSAEAITGMQLVLPEPGGSHERVRSALAKVRN